MSGSDRSGPRLRRNRRAGSVAVGAVALALALGGCSGDDPGPAAASGDAATVIAWARDDLGFRGATDCLAHYLAGVDLGGIGLEDLRAHHLDLVPLAARQQIGDAVVVCGIEGPGG